MLLVAVSCCDCDDIAGTLEEHGQKIVFSTDLKNALQVLLAQPNIEVVLTDLFPLLRTIKVPTLFCIHSQRPKPQADPGLRHIIVIMVSNSWHHGTVAACASLGAADCFGTPIRDGPMKRLLQLAVTKPSILAVKVD
jgi:CheY-like chemotaxis protein